MHIELEVAVELAVLVFAVVMGGLALSVVVYCTVVEMTEAWNISHRGWARGHREHRVRHHA